MSLRPGSNGILTPGGTPFPHGMDTDIPPSYANHSTTWTPVDSMTPISTNSSRKRSRDETAFDNADADGSYFPSLVDQVNTPAPIPEEEPIYGEGMMLMNTSGACVSAESQTGTWYEERVAEQQQIQQIQQQQEEEAEFRPKMPTSRKSVRLSQASVPTVLSANNPFSSSGAGTAPASPPKAAGHPLVDTATLALGVGWSKISEDPDVQAAARGWARYLENHYPTHIHAAEILLKSEGLNAYLVACQEGYYLFREDLLDGQLVGRSWETALINLRASPLQFEGEETLRAEKTPVAGEKSKEITDRPPNNGNHDDGRVMMQNWEDYNRLHSDGHAMVDGGMEID